MTLRENAANSAVDALESVEVLDGAALKLAGAVSNAVPVGVPRNVLGGDDTGQASERLIEVGLVAAAPTVASGLMDWSMTV